MRYDVHAAWHCYYRSIKSGISTGGTKLTPLSDAHSNKLSLKYGVDTENPQIKSLVDSGLLGSISSTEELQAILMRNDVVGTGIYIGYSNDSGTFTIRLDEPLRKDSKEVKYLRRSGELNHLFVPPGIDLTNANNTIITEGELKSLSGYLRGLPVVALSGIYNWPTQGPEAELLSEGEKLKDSEALIQELRRDWKGKQVTLLYDSDITRDHPGYSAFERLAEQLYRQGAEEVKIVTLPSLDEKGKTGLDDFLLTKGESGPEELKRIIGRVEPYLPLSDGANAYAERLIKSDNLGDKIKAAVAYLSRNDEFITRDWLKNYVLLGDDRKSLLRDAKSRLKEIKKNLEVKQTPAAKASNLGPLYERPYSMLRGSDYVINEKGYLCKMEIRRAEGADAFVPKPLCNFVPYPLRQVLKDNGLEVERSIEVAGIRPDGKLFGPSIIPLTLF